MQNSIPHAASSSWELPDDHSTLLKAIRPSNGHEPMTRKRNPLACEWCYKKKVKCEVEGVNTACVQCVRRNIKCKFTTRKEKREALKRAQYARALEERLRRTETLLRAAGVLDEAAIDQEELYNDEDEQSTSDVESEDEIAPVSTNLPIKQEAPLDREPKKSSRKPAAKSASKPSATSTDLRPGRLPGNSDAQQIPVFKMDHREEFRYYGRASSLSILSREGIEWIKNKTGDTKFLNFICSHSAHDSPWDYWRADVFHDLFSSKVYRPLPPRSEVFSLVKDYFRTSNRLFPLYHEPSFMRLVEWQYTQQTCNDAAWWASINVILALAYEYRISDNLKPERDREKAWHYFKNAMAVFPELALRRTDLLSLQALLGLAFFLRGNSGTQTAMPIVTAAMRSCHRMGLHRDIPRPHLPQTELEQRRRVFWVSYVLDQSTCVRAGSAPAQHVDDFDVGLPEVDPNGTPFFRQLCSLNIIKSRIYSRLYSTKGLQNSPEEICQIVRELHAELEEWKNDNPIDNSHLNHVNGDGFLLGFASVGLQFVYFNSLIMIHRMPLVLYYYARTLENESRIHFDPKWFGDQSRESASVCVQAARDTLRLVNSMPWGDIAWIWSLLYYVFLAVMTLFVNILRDSKNPKAKDDLQSLNMAATFFATLIPGDWPCYYAKFMARMCANFERIARMVIEREEKSTKNRPSHKSSRPLVKGQVASSNSSRQPPQMPRPISSSTPGMGADMEIPNLEGFPPINSSGYVVPGSPTPSTTTSTNVNNTHLTHPLQTTPTATLTPSYPNPNPNQQSSTTTPLPDTTIFPTTSTTSATTPTDPSSSVSTISTPWPDFWQIPLTADWEFGNQFLSGLFTHEYNYQPPAGQNPFLHASTTNTTTTTPGGPTMAQQQQGDYFFDAGGTHASVGFPPQTQSQRYDPAPGLGPGVGQGLGQGRGQGGGREQGRNGAIWMDGGLDSMA